MRAPAMLPCTIVLALLPVAASAGPPLKIACVELTLEAGVAESTRDLLYERLLAQVEAAGPHEVLGKTDIDTMLGLEEERQKLGCLDQASCVAEIGGALGVQQIISGNIGRIGESLLFNLKRIDVRSARAVGRVSRRFKGGSEEQVLDALPEIVDELFASGLASESASADRAATSSGGDVPGPGGGVALSREQGAPSFLSSQGFWGWLAIGVGGAAVLTGAGVGGYALQLNTDLGNKRYDPDTYDDTVSAIDQSALAADVLLGVGLAAAAVGAVLLLLDDGDDAPEAGTAWLELFGGPAAVGLRGSF